MIPADKILGAQSHTLTANFRKIAVEGAFVLLLCSLRTLKRVTEGITTFPCALLDFWALTCYTLR